MHEKSIVTQQPAYPEEAPITTPAGDLGLVDGQFIVERSDKSKETGWSVNAIIPASEETRGIELVEIVRPGEKGKIDSKKIPLSRLIGWQKGPQNSGRVEPLVSHELGNLTVAAAHPESVMVVPEQEKPAQTRIEKIFAPYETKTQPEDEDDYSQLFDEANDMSGLEVEGGAIRPDQRGRGVVTPESEKESFLALDNAMKSDPAIRRIIMSNPNAKGGQLEVESIPKLLRTNKDLRLSLGTYLLNKLDRMVTYREDMPYRIVQNTKKSSLAAGYEEFKNIGLRSREFSAMLALSMLDGTFGEESEPETYDSLTGKGDGQHRYTARQLLFSQ